MATRSWNRVELIGNLTRDPELRYTPTGTAVVTFSIATNRTYVSDGEKKEDVDFHRIVAWNKLAELCSQLLKKGNRVFVSGRLQNRSWEGQDGQQRNTTEIVIEDMIMLNTRSGESESFGEDVSRESSAVSSQPLEKKESQKTEPEPEPETESNAEATPDKEEKAESPKTEEVNPDDIPF